MCTFCDIAGGRVAAEVVFEDAISLAFLDHRPLFHGHTLLIPRDHHETLADLPGDLVEPVFANARFLSMAVQEAMGADGTFVAMNNTVSQSVPHVHVHIVPRRRKDGLRGFFWPRRRYDRDEMQTTAEAVRRAVARMGTPT